MTDEDEQPYYWIVMFRQGEKPYTYLRTEAEMVDVVKRNLAKKNVYPHRMWRIRDDKMETVTIT